MSMYRDSATQVFVSAEDVSPPSPRTGHSWVSRTHLHTWTESMIRSTAHVLNLSILDNMPGPRFHWTLLGNSREVGGAGGGYSIIVLTLSRGRVWVWVWVWVLGGPPAGIQCSSSLHPHLCPSLSGGGDGPLEAAPTIHTYLLPELCDVHLIT